MPRLALATCAALPELDADSALVLPELTALGVAAEVLVWDRPDVEWDAYDLVAVRSVWDYTGRREEFLAWARAVPRLVNPYRVLAWNTSKTYLHDLAQAGVPVVPTVIAAPGEAYDLPPGADEVVVKPAVSAGAQDTARVPAGQAGPLVAALHRRGRTAVVQPYQRAVDDAGETAVVWFDGALSHSARKAPLLVPGVPPPDAYDDDADDEVVSARTATDEEVAGAAAALAVVPGSGGTLPYARVDLVPGDDGRPRVLEVEVTEPTLFLRQAPGSAARFAAALARRLG